MGDVTRHGLRGPRRRLTASVATLAAATLAALGTLVAGVRAYGLAGRLASTLRVLVPALAIVSLVLAMNGTWTTSRSAHAAPATQAEREADGTGSARPPRGGKKAVSGKVNLNTATEEQLMLLPTVGPAKAERIVTWRKKHGGFKRIADLRRVKGFGYKTFKRLAPLLAVTGETTLTAE